MTTPGHNHRGHPPAPDDEMEQAAGMWLARRDRGLTAREQAEFTAWLAADPHHGAILEGLEGPFRALDRAAGLRPVAGTVPDSDLLLSAVRAPVRILAGDSTHGLDRWRGRLVRFPILVAAAAAVAVGLFVLRSNWALAPVSSARGSVMRHAPERKPLPDGSLIECKRDAQVEVAYSATERRVRLLAGEAHFTVVHNPARPFVVVANDVAVHAVGTAFSVSRGSSRIEVVVTEGRVRVDDAQNRSLIDPNRPAVPQPNDRVSQAESEPLLLAGQRVAIPIVDGAAMPAPIVAVPSDEMARTLAWRVVWLEFANMPLADVTSEFNRYNDRKVRTADGATGRILVSGMFRADGVDAFVRLLASSFGVTVERGENDETILRKTPATQAPK